ncbi:hypothetical protein M9Y10_035304 [Tritrichomonas musculus]|uniref:Protein kinase domain-containing protein n=1 Tax=Tritrichomonas musculus TaxID=1915356 RepID=A0ABR2KHE1_9EUKA
MTQLSSLPSTLAAWSNYLNQVFRIVDDALSTVVFSRNKCRLIANEMGRFLQRFARLKQVALRTRDLLRLFEFAKATTAFVGIVSSYQANSWLSFFLNTTLDKSYKDLSELWIAWSDCATVFCMLDIFEDSDALANAHAADLMEVYNIFSAQLSEMPVFLKDIIQLKLDEISSILKSTEHVIHKDDIMKYILTENDWEVITPDLIKGNYTILHLAKLKSTGQNVAVKELQTAQLTTRRINYLKREIFSMRNLHHFNLLNMIGVTLTPPFCIVTDYYPNGSLHNFIRSEKFTPKLANMIALDIARALEYLHAQGMIHRNLKPSNILMNEDYRAIVCDFCLTRMASSVMSSELGSVQWMAPEILSQTGHYDITIDVYAYGMILYEMATHETPFNGLMPLQVASKVLAGERPSFNFQATEANNNNNENNQKDQPSPSPNKVSPFGITGFSSSYQNSSQQNTEPAPEADLPQKSVLEVSESIMNLIRRCWSQEQSQRPSMHQIVAELETGTIVFTGSDATEFRQWARKTSPMHKEAMESLLKESSDKLTLIARLSNLNPLDALAIPTLEQIRDLKIEDRSVVDNLVSLALQTTSEEVAELSLKVLESLVEYDKNDADYIAQSLLRLWEKQPSFVAENLQKISKRLENRERLIRMILTQKTQNAQTVDAVEAIIELNDLSTVFEFLDPSLVAQTLSFALTRFGPVKEMIPASVTSYPALSQLLRMVVKDNKYQAIYLTEADSTKVESIITMLSSSSFMENPKNLQFIIENLSTMLHKGGPGYVTLNLLDNGARFPQVAEMITNMNFWTIIAHAFDSPRDEICNTALSIASKLNFNEDNIRTVWEPLLSCFTRTHNDSSMRLIQKFIKQAPKLDITGFIIGLLTGLELNKPEAYAQILFSFDFAECTAYFDQSFWRLVAKEIRNLSTASTAAVALFALKYQSEAQTSVISYDFIGALLSFLYKQTAPFSCITPVLQEILNMASNDDAAIFLTHHHFIQYLHQMPLRYPNEPKVTNILLHFASTFESVSESIKSKNQ